MKIVIDYNKDKKLLKNGDFVKEIINMTKESVINTIEFINFAAIDLNTIILPAINETTDTGIIELNGSLVTYTATEDELKFNNILIDDDQWIPVAKDLPPKYGWYLVTMEGPNLTRWTDRKTYYPKKKRFCNLQGNKVLAWQLLPEEFKG